MDDEKQQILKICQENTQKMESVIVCTDSKTTSEPPVEEVLLLPCYQ